MLVQAGASPSQQPNVDMAEVVLNLRDSPGTGMRCGSMKGSGNVQSTLMRCFRLPKML